MKDYKQYFRTVTGHHVFPQKLNFDFLTIDDIAIPLSKVCRYAGHLPGDKFYSVAEHSVFVSELVEFRGGTPKECLTALMHDATEAFVGDCPSPFKNLIKDFKVVENMIYTEIARKFNLLDPIPDIVEEADVHAFVLECRVLRDGNAYLGINGIPPSEARYKFISRFFYLNKVILDS